MSRTAPAAEDTCSNTGACGRTFHIQTTTQRKTPHYTHPCMHARMHIHTYSMKQTRNYQLMEILIFDKLHFFFSCQLRLAGYFVKLLKNVVACKA